MLNQKFLRILRIVRPTKRDNIHRLSLIHYLLLFTASFFTDVVAAEPQVEYEIRHLGENFSVNDINEAAWIVGKRYGKATLYNGKHENLITEPGAIRSNATSINNHGQIVGSWTYFNDTVDKETPVWFFQNFHDLPGNAKSIIMPSYHSTELTAINDMARAVGYAINEQELSCALSYISDPSCMPFDPPLSARATDINQLGDIVANYEAEDAVSHAILIPNGGVPNDLDILKDYPSRANAINSHADNLQIVGWYEDAGIRKAYVYKNGVVEDLGFLPNGTRAEALDVNNKGQVVGTAWVLNDAGENEEQRAFIYDPINGMRDLTALIANNRGWVLQKATAINERGWIVGDGLRYSTPAGFLLSPYPSLQKMQQPKLLPEDAGSGNRIGTSVAISGDTMLVGAPNINKVFVYKKQHGAWQEITSLTSPEKINYGGDFGSSIAISGDIAAIGAPDATQKILQENGDPRTVTSGVVYLFKKNVEDNWLLLKKLAPSDGASFDKFGSAIAMDGKTIVVGANGKDSDLGAVYVFADDSTNSWDSGTRLVDDRPTGERRSFGAAVAIDSNVIVVGAPKEKLRSTGIYNNLYGTAYIFVRDDPNNWYKFDQRINNTVWNSGGFASAVAVQEDKIFIRSCATKSVSNVSVYKKIANAETWSLWETIVTNDQYITQDFGNSIALHNNTLVVGAPGDDRLGANAGAAYMFQLTGGYWVQRKKLVAHDANEDDNFGSSVAIDGANVVVGSPRDGDWGPDTGSIYPFTLCDKECSDEPSIDVSLTAIGEPAEVSVNNLIRYHLTVTNNDLNVSASGLKIKSKLISSTPFVASDDCGYEVTTGSVVCTINSLAAGEFTAASLQVRAPRIVGIVENTFCVDRLGSDPDSSNNCDAVETRVNSPEPPEAEILLPIENQQHTLAANEPVLLDYDIRNFVVAPLDSHFQLWLNGTFKQSYHQIKRPIDLTQFGNLPTGENTVTLMLVDHESKPIPKVDDNGNVLQDDEGDPIIVEDSVTFHVRYENPDLTIAPPENDKPFKRIVGQAYKLQFDLVDWELMPGEKSLRLTVDESEIGTYYENKPIVLSDLEDGDHQLCLELVNESDINNNPGVKRCIKVTIETLQPEIHIKSLEAGGDYEVAPDRDLDVVYLTNNWELGVSGDRVEIVVNSIEDAIHESQNEISKKLTYKQIPEGEHSITARLIDYNGNVRASSTPINITIVHLIPSITIQSPTHGQEIYSNETNLKFSATIENSADENIEWYVNGQLLSQKIEFSYDLSALELDNYKDIEVIAKLVSQNGEEYSKEKMVLPIKKKLPEMPSENSSGGGAVAWWFVLVILFIIIGRFNYKRLYVIGPGFFTAAKRLVNTGIVFIIFCTSIVHASELEYEIRNLGADFSVVDINDLSVVIGSKDGKAALYDGTVKTLLDVTSNAIKINNNNQLVGQYRAYNEVTGTWEMIAYQLDYPNIEVTKQFLLPGDKTSMALDINDVGRVVGYSENTDGVKRAFEFVGGTMFDISELSDSGRIAHAINANGVIVGEAWDDSLTPNAFRHWPNGVNDNFFSLEGLSSKALAINNLDDNSHQILGQYQNLNGDTRSFLHSSGSSKDIGTLGGVWAKARGLNDLNQVVGSSSVITTANGEVPRAFILNDVTSNESLQDLNQFLTEPSAWLLTDAININNRGNIIGSGQFNGQAINYLMLPKPALFVTEQPAITSAAAGASAGFGSSVARSGNLLIVGMHTNQVVYLYELQGAEWQQISTLTPSNAENAAGFGNAVAIQNQTIIVGAPGGVANGINSGVAYVFQQNEALQWFETQILSPSDGGSRNAFGSAIAIDNNVIAIGAPADPGTGSCCVLGSRRHKGSVYIFSQQPQDTWQEVQKFDGLRELSKFGAALTFSDTTLVVGAPNTGGSCGLYSGCFAGKGTVHFLEQEDSGEWTVMQSVTPSDAVWGEVFGSAIAADHNVLVVGAPGGIDNSSASGNGSGAAYLYVRDNGTWTRKDKLTTNQSVTGDGFGSSVAIDGEMVLVGAPGVDNDSNLDVGAAYVFQRQGNYWVNSTTITAADGKAGDLYAQSVSLQGQMAIVASSKGDGNAINSGRVHVHSLCYADCLTVQTANVSISARYTPANVQVRNKVTVELTVTNISNENTAQGIFVSATMSSAMNFISSGECNKGFKQSIDSYLVNCSITTLGRGESAVFEFEVMAPSNVGDIENCFNVQATGLDPELSNNTECATVVIIPAGEPEIIFFSPAENSDVNLLPEENLVLNYEIRNWLVAEGDNHFLLYLNGVLQNARFSTAPINLGYLPEGDHSVTLELVNADGSSRNVENTLSFSVKHVAPTITVTSLENDQIIERSKGEPILIEFESQHWPLIEGKHIDWYLNDELQAHLHSTDALDISHLADGNYTITLVPTAADETARPESYSISFSLVTLKPQLTIVSPSKEKTFVIGPNSPLIFSFSISNWLPALSNEKLQWYLDNNHMGEIETIEPIAIDFTALENGSHIIELKLLDTENNVVTQSSVSFDVMVRMPQVNIITPEQDKLLSTSLDSVTLTYRISNPEMLENDTELYLYINEAVGEKIPLESFEYSIEVAKLNISEDSSNVVELRLKSPNHGQLSSASVAFTFSTDVPVAQKPPVDESDSGGGSLSWLMLLVLVNLKILVHVLERLPRRRKRASQ